MTGMLQTGAYLARRDEKVCLIICGANVDPASLA
jgi:threonine dehydratase